METSTYNVKIYTTSIFPCSSKVIVIPFSDYEKLTNEIDKSYEDFHSKEGRKYGNIVHIDEVCEVPAYMLQVMNVADIPYIMCQGFCIVSGKVAKGLHYLKRFLDK